MVQEQFCEAHNFTACLYPERTPENESSTVAVTGDSKMMPPFDEPGNPILMPVINPDGGATKVTWIDSTSPISILGHNPIGMVLPCGFGFAKMFAPPETYHGFYSALRAGVYTELASPDRPLFLSRQDKLRAERVMRQIAVIDGKPLQSPQPYVNCDDVCLKARRCRYPMLNYHRAFYMAFNKPRNPDEHTDMPDNTERDDASSLLQSSSKAIEAGSVMVNDTWTDMPMAMPTYGVIFNQLTLGMSDYARHRDLALIAMLCGLNGGIHLAAWNYIFPTKIESQLWRVAGLLSAIVWLALVLIQVVITLVTKLTGPHKLRYQQHGLVMVRGLFCLNLAGSIVAGLLIYFSWIGRIYLIVEAFISLRHMPYGVYVMPSWLELLPHL